MNQVTLENFRCFRDEQQARLAPLTLLVGENSTGKTSFLALLRALWDAAYAGMIPDFKEAPYDLGSFDEIAHFRGGRSGRAQEFRAGFDFVPNEAGRHRKAAGSDRRPLRFKVTFNRKGTAPSPAVWSFGREDVEITIRVGRYASQEIRFRIGKIEWSWSDTADPGAKFLVGRDIPLALYAFGRLTDTSKLKPAGDFPEMTADDLARLEEIIYGFDVRYRGEKPFASAPVRSKPRRTYDPSQTAHDSEGKTIPTYLSTAFFEDKKSWKKLKEELESFGQEAGLFDEIAVKPLGKRGSEPFQMQVRKRAPRAMGPMRNLIDVGYGVSQVLPVITELFRDSETPMFLLQQPEVHLHPSAQAALGSLFCRIANRRRQLVIETHSDHLLDRVRMDVRDGRGKLKPDDVSILFFERGNLDVRIHSLRLDGEGNVLNAPPSYRRFFMEETKRSLRL